jgi:Flp pilus assembly protein TadG
MNRPRGWAGDRGAATLELAVLFPVILLLVFGTVQAALHFHARNIAQAAAAQAVSAGSVTTGTTGSAAAAAERFLAAAGDGTLVDTAVDVQRSPAAVTATVTGRAISILPGIGMPAIRQTVSGPVEPALP